MQCKNGIRRLAGNEDEGDGDDDGLEHGFKNR